MESILAISPMPRNDRVIDQAVDVAAVIALSAGTVAITQFWILKCGPDLPVSHILKLIDRASDVAKVISDHLVVRSQSLMLPIIGALVVPYHGSHRWGLIERVLLFFGV